MTEIDLRCRCTHAHEDGAGCSDCGCPRRSLETVVRRYLVRYLAGRHYAQGEAEPVEGLVEALSIEEAIAALRVSFPPQQSNYLQSIVLIPEGPVPRVTFALVAGIGLLPASVQATYRVPFALATCGRNLREPR